MRSVDTTYDFIMQGDFLVIFCPSSARIGLIFFCLDIKLIVHRGRILSPDTIKIVEILARTANRH